MAVLHNDTLTMEAVGLFSSWCLHRPTRTLFDCGDGAAQRLGSHIFAVERIVIGHAHVDHIAGLLAFVGLRDKAMGANDKPLQVWYPAADATLQPHLDYVRNFHREGRLQYELTFHPMAPQDVIPLSPKVYLKAFPVRHTAASLGFCVYNESHRLRAGIDPRTVGPRLAAGELRREDVSERCDVRLFAYTLDNIGFDVAEIAGVHEVVLDCTFLKASDRGAPTHASLAECREIIAASACRKAYLAHISPRYEAARRAIIEWTPAGTTLAGQPVDPEALAGSGM